MNIVPAEDIYGDNMNWTPLIGVNWFYARLLQELAIALNAKLGLAKQPEVDFPFVGSGVNEQWFMYCYGRSAFYVWSEVIKSMLPIIEKYCSGGFSYNETRYGGLIIWKSRGTIKSIEYAGLAGNKIPVKKDPPWEGNLVNNNKSYWKLGSGGTPNTDSRWAVINANTYPPSRLSNVDSAGNVYAYSVDAKGHYSHVTKNGGFPVGQSFAGKILDMHVFPDGRILICGSFVRDLDRGQLASHLSIYNPVSKIWEPATPWGWATALYYHPCLHKWITVTMPTGLEICSTVFCMTFDVDGGLIIQVENAGCGWSSPVRKCVVESGSFVFYETFPVPRTGNIRDLTNSFIKLKNGTFQKYFYYYPGCYWGCRIEQREQEITTSNDGTLYSYILGQVEEAGFQGSAKPVKKYDTHKIPNATDLLSAIILMREMIDSLHMHHNAWTVVDGNIRYTIGMTNAISTPIGRYRDSEYSKTPLYRCDRYSQESYAQGISHFYSPTLIDEAFSGPTEADAVNNKITNEFHMADTPAVFYPMHGSDYIPDRLPKDPEMEPKHVVGIAYNASQFGVVPLMYLRKEQSSMVLHPNIGALLLDDLTQTIPRNNILIAFSEFFHDYGMQIRKGEPCYRSYYEANYTMNIPMKPLGWNGKSRVDWIHTFQHIDKINKQFNYFGGNTAWDYQHICTADYNGNVTYYGCNRGTYGFSAFQAVNTGSYHTIGHFHHHGVVNSSNAYAYSQDFLGPDATVGEVFGHIYQNADPAQTCPNTGHYEAAIIGQREGTISAWTTVNHLPYQPVCSLLDKISIYIDMESPLDGRDNGKLMLNKAKVSLPAPYTVPANINSTQTHQVTYTTELNEIYFNIDEQLETLHDYNSITGWFDPPSSTIGQDQWEANKIVEYIIIDDVVTVNGTVRCDNGFSKKVSLTKWDNPFEYIDIPIKMLKDNGNAVIDAEFNTGE